MAGVLERLAGTVLSAFGIGTSVVTTLTANAVGLDIGKPVVTDGWGGRVVSITAADSPYTPTDSSFILADASAGPITIALPALATANERVYFVKKTDTSGNAVTIDPDGAEKINTTLSTYSINTPNDGLTLQAATGATWQITGTVSRADLLTIYTDSYGDGVDGDTTIAGTTTLTRTSRYNNLVVTGTLNTANFVVMVHDRLSGNGTIQCVGPAAVGGTGATAVTSTYLNGGTNGGNGGSNANGNNGTNRGNSLAAFGTTANAGDGGTGGISGGTRVGGTAGNATIPAVTSGSQEDPAIFLFGFWNETIPIGGGAGGSGGGGELNSTGGGGGAGGGSILVRARILDFSGTISANGGNGGNAAIGTGTGAGGGGGGGGGAILLVTEELRTAPTITKAGGTGGALAGTGAVGGNGVEGHSQTVTRVSA